MGNIANPLAGTKVDGSTFTAAECNAVGAALPRCLVNDGQSDLIANASIHGGANKSFAFAGLTTFGLACSGARTESCGAYGLTCAGGLTVGCTTYALTCSGAATVACAGLTIASSANASIAVSGANRTIALSTADGSVSVTAGGASSNLNLTAGVDILFAPGFAGGWGGPAGKLVLSGTGWPQIGSRAFGTYLPPSSPVVVSGFAPSVTLPGRINQSASGGFLDFYLTLPPGALVGGAVVRVVGVGSGIPATGKPELSVYSLDTITGAVTQLGATAVDASGSAAAYVAVHGISATFTPITIAVTQRLFLRLKGAVDADPDKWIAAMPAPTVALTMTELRLA